MPTPAAPASGPYGFPCPRRVLLGGQCLGVEIGELLGTPPAGCLFSPGSSPGPSLVPPVWTGSGRSGGRTAGHAGAARGLCTALAGRTPGTSQRLPARPRPDCLLECDCRVAVAPEPVGASGSRRRCPAAWALVHGAARPSVPRPGPGSRGSARCPWAWGPGGGSWPLPCSQVHSVATGSLFWNRPGLMVVQFWRPHAGSSGPSCLCRAGSLHSSLRDKQITGLATPTVLGTSLPDPAPPWG